MSAATHVSFGPDIVQLVGRPLRGLLQVIVGLLLNHVALGHRLVDVFFELSQVGVHDRLGIDALFLETHPDPDSAKSDGPNMVSLDSLENLLRKVLAVHRAAGAAEREE